MKTSGIVQSVFQQGVLEITSPSGETHRVANAGHGSWFHVGHTGSCDFETRLVDPGTVLFRLLLVSPFLFMENNGRVTVHFAEAQLDFGDARWTVKWLKGRSLASRLKVTELSTLMSVLGSDFFEEVDAFLQNLRLDIDHRVSSLSPISQWGVPSEDFLLSIESAVSRRMDTPGDQLDALVWRTAQCVYWSLYGFGILEPLLDDPGLKEIVINGPDEIYRESSQGLERVPCGFGSEERYQKFIESLLWQLGARLDSSNPVASGVLRGRYRVHIVSGQLASGTAVLSIRCFPETVYSLDSLIGEERDFLRPVLARLIMERKNILVCGSTSSGKTTLLEALSEFIAPDERVIVAEDVRELRLRNQHRVHLQTRDASGSDVSGFCLRGLVRESLRMRPDRIVIGECRGAEALDLLQALNTGHAGSLTSIHGSSVQSALLRLETLALFGSSQIARDTVSALVAGGIDYVILMGRTRDGVRCVHEIAELRPTQVSGGASYTLRFLYRWGTKASQCRPSTVGFLCEAQEDRP